MFRKKKEEESSCKKNRTFETIIPRDRGSSNEWTSGALHSARLDKNALCAKVEWRRERGRVRLVEIRLSESSHDRKVIKPRRWRIAVVAVASLWWVPNGRLMPWHEHEQPVGDINVSSSH